MIEAQLQLTVVPLDGCSHGHIRHLWRAHNTPTECAHEGTFAFAVLDYCPLLHDNENL